MRSQSRSVAILICLFLISFKVAAGSIFVDAAIERAQMHQSDASFVAHVSLEDHAGVNSTDGEQQSHTLYLMSHVTATISDPSIFVPAHSTKAIVFGCSNEIIYTQNFPDSAFKPPKTIA